MFEMFDHENLGQGHGVQNSQWSRSMADISVYKSHKPHFCASSHRFRDINLTLKSTLHYQPI